jgi:spore maturation protein CgeB
MSILLKTVEWFRKRRGRLVVFVGNEYNLMADKIEFIRSTEADYVCSQLPFEAARWLYEGCKRSKILAIPHALNPKLYSPHPCPHRTIDIGFIGHLYDYFIGDLERTNLIQFFQRNGRGLGMSCDIRTQRLPREGWAQFLRRCRGILGAESGTYYLDRTGRIIEDVRKYAQRNPKVSFEEIHGLFFKKHQCPVSGKAISSRHFEAIGTKTCQILIEGHYNGILVPNQHYISVKKDLSNMSDVVYRFKDENYRNEMTQRAYEYVMDGHTYRHRVDLLLRTIWDDLRD